MPKGVYERKPVPKEKREEMTRKSNATKIERHGTLAFGAASKDISKEKRQTIVEKRKKNINGK